MNITQFILLMSLYIVSHYSILHMFVLDIAVIFIVVVEYICAYLLNIYLRMKEMSDLKNMYMQLQLVGLNQQFSIIAKSVNSLTSVSESSGYFIWSSSFNTSIFPLFLFRQICKYVNISIFCLSLFLVFFLSKNYTKSTFNNHSIICYENFLCVCVFLYISVYKNNKYHKINALK